MRLHANLHQITLFLVLVSLVAACKTSAKLSKSRVSTVQPIAKEVDICIRKIKYYSDKIRMPNGEETNMKTEVVIDPSAKTITISSEPPNQQKVNFTTVIETIDCHINADLTNGTILYTGYIKQLDGTSSIEKVQLVAKEGGLLISSADTQRKSDFVILVSRWEPVSE